MDLPRKFECQSDRSRSPIVMNGRDDEHEERASTPKVAYMWSKQYEQVCDNLPSNIGRVLPQLTAQILTPVVITRSFPHPRIWPRQTHDVLSPPR